MARNTFSADELIATVMLVVLLKMNPGLGYTALGFIQLGNIDLESANKILRLLQEENLIILLNNGLYYWNQR